MQRKMLRMALLTAALAVGIAGVSQAQIVLDLDPAPGDHAGRFLWEPSSISIFYKDTTE
mgnify:CR=1 FL=1